MFIVGLSSGKIFTRCPGILEAPGATRSTCSAGFGLKEVLFMGGMERANGTTDVVPRPSEPPVVVTVIRVVKCSIPLSSPVVGTRGVATLTTLSEKQTTLRV